MAFPIHPECAVTDSVASVNLEVVGLAPALAAANLYLANSQALALAAMNAVCQQQAAFEALRATTAESVRGSRSRTVVDDTPSSPPVFA